MSNAPSPSAAAKAGASGSLSVGAGAGLCRVASCRMGRPDATVVQLCSGSGAAVSGAFAGSGRMSRSGAEGCAGRGTADAAGRRGLSVGCGRLPGSACPEMTAESPVKQLFFTFIFLALIF